MEVISPSTMKMAYLYVMIGCAGCNQIITAINTNQIGDDFITLLHYAVIGNAEIISRNRKLFFFYKTIGNPQNLPDPI